jgi:hypothetical protein
VRTRSSRKNNNVRASSGRYPGEVLRQLALVRAEYDKHMRSLLGEDVYRQYLVFEASKPALREYEMLREFALEKRDLSLDPAEAHVLVDLIGEAGATTTVTWSGPYDPLPRPMAGDLLIGEKQLRLARSREHRLAGRWIQGYIGRQCREILTGFAPHTR